MPAHVVAHVVGDGGRVAWVVLGYVSLHLAHKVGSHIGSLCINATSHTGKKRLRTGTHTKSQHRSSDDTEFMSGCQHIGRYRPIEQQIPKRDVEQSQADYYQSHHSSASEGYSQSGIQ